MTPQTTKKQFSFKEELKLVHPMGWVLGAIVLFLWEFFLVPPVITKILAKAGAIFWFPAAILIISGVIMGALVPLVFYVNADAKRRQMNRLLWTLLVIFVPNAIGFIVYFFMRKPIASSCPQCSATVQADFTFCPECGETLASNCPSCRRAIEDGWAACAYCGEKLESGRAAA